MLVLPLESMLLEETCPVSEVKIVHFAYGQPFCRSGSLLFLQIGNCGYLSNSSTFDLYHNNSRFGWHKELCTFRICVTIKNFALSELELGSKTHEKLHLL